MFKQIPFKKILVSILIITAMMAIPNKIELSSDSPTDDVKYPSVFALTDDDKAWIEKKLNEMSLSEKCAQMMMPAVYREDLDTASDGYKKIISIVSDKKIGGLILFQGRLADQVKFLNQVQQISEIPLLVSADYERGLGNRIDDATEFPHAMALGSTLNSSYVYEVGKAIAEECTLLGVHMIFAPVADVNNNPLNPVINIRSYSEDINVVSEFVREFIEGTKNYKVLTSAKHFPGHGNTEIDSHYDLPRINGDKEFLNSNELKPFRVAIDAGVQSMMIGHLEVPALEPIPGTPSTLSKSVVSSLLKNEMEFDGLIITDAMNMDAVRKYYSDDEAVVMSVLAGCDIILMPADPEISISALVNAVNSGRISVDRINESVRKILSAKRWLQIDKSRNADIDSLLNELQNAEHLNLSKKIAEESITLLKNDSSLVPLITSKYNKISCVTITDGEGSERSIVFQSMLEKRLVNVSSYLISKNSGSINFDTTLNALRKSDLIILPVFIDVKTYQGPIDLSVKLNDFISEVLKLKIPTILLSFKNPYIASLFPDCPVILNTFSHSKSSQKAALRAILGETDIFGTLPVTIPETEFGYGDGLTMLKSVNTVLDFSQLNKSIYPQIDKLVSEAINEKLFPGTVVCFGNDGKLLYNKAFGNSGYGENAYVLNADDIFNLSYESRIVAGISSLMIMIDNGLLKADDKVHTFFRDFYSYDKKDITVTNLVHHSSGFGPIIKNVSNEWTRNELIHSLGWQVLDYKTGTDAILSPVNDIILQLLIENVSGKSTDNILYENVFNKLKMSNTRFLNDSELKSNPIPYSPVTNGNNHSPKNQNDFVKVIMDGNINADGLYSRTTDLALFAQTLIQNGYYDDVQVFSAETVEKFRIYCNSIKPNGCSILIDEKADVFIILLSNPEENKTANEQFIRFFNELKNIVYYQTTTGTQNE
jgi:beta-glucosidase-like glycosyl hydrolase/CubicO group peptidase (beta-lactamase class C family)